MTEAPAPILLGLETEYAVSGSVPAARRSTIGAAFQGAAMNHYPWLPDRRGTGIFLGNGARFYVDAGDHPEYATPECTSPFDLLDQIRQGEAFMADLALRVAALNPASEVAVYRSNVDYRCGSSNRTPPGWGCHENYMVRDSPDQYAAELMPHLASRIIYTGAGGLDPGSPAIGFSLSPRVGLLEAEISAESTARRPLLHIRDEPHNGRHWHRAHLICGESVCGDVPIVLKAGVTALVLVAIQAGLGPGPAVALASPLAAIKTFAADPNCRAIVKLADGRSVTAVELQFCYLRSVESALAGGLLPAWAPAVIRLWTEHLETLERDPTDAADSLDWVMKHELFARWVGSRRWSQSRTIPGLLPRMKRVARRLGGGALQGLLFELLERSSAGSGEVERLAPLLRGSGSTWQELVDILSLRPALQELDFRFGQLGGAGVFEQLDRQGLCRRPVERSVRDTPLGDPPADTRAKFRADVVRQHGHDAGRVRFACDWERVVDRTERKVLDISDPFERAAEWAAMAPEAERPLTRQWRFDAECLSEVF